ncbi:MAG: hypothetical protein ABSB49_08980 [Polyangia bacterium]|jgi:folate-binding protein YgfZ
MPSASELQAIREAAVLTEGAGHDILRVTGNDRVGFLQRISSGKVAGLEVGQGGPTLLLDVRGRVLAELRIFVRQRSIRIMVPSGQGQLVVDGLSRYAVMDDFQIGLESDSAALALLGPRAGTALAAVGVSVPPELMAAPPYTNREVAGQADAPLWLARVRAMGTDGLCLVAGRATREALVQALLANGIPRLSDEMGEALRILAMEPRQGAEITSDRFPVEVGLGGAIDHGKGCYVGQETIVRMRDRGNVRKRLVLLRLRDLVLPKAGAKLVAPGQPNAGVVTSSAQIPGETPVALAIVATAVPIGAAVDLHDEGGVHPAEIVSEAPPWG